MVDGYEVPDGVTYFTDNQGRRWSLVGHPCQLTVADKVKVINEVLLPLRGYQMIGLVESRDWIEELFPEFKMFRDSDTDEYIRTLASESGPAGPGEEDVHGPE